MRQKRVKISLLAIVFFVSTLLFAVALKQYSLNAAAADGDPSQTEATTDSSSHHISIFDENAQINVRSGATTVRDALIRANIELNEGDKVEPALDEEIGSNDFNINIYRARDLVVVDGNHRIHVKTASTSPEDIVADAGVELLDEDLVNLVQYNNLLESGNTLAYKVTRAKTVNIDFYGKKLNVRTQAKTVAQLLKEQEIDTNSEKNWISVSLRTKISDGMKFSIQPQGIQTITLDEEINYGEKVTQDYDMEYGKRQVTKYGEKGKKTVTYEVNMRNGVELSRKKISEIIVKAPVQQEVKVGMKISLPSGSHEDWMAAAGISSGDYGYVNYIISHESGWRTNASNGRYFGLYQTSKARLVSDCGGNWVNDPVCQLRSATKYANGRYGSWSNAYKVWTSRGWW